MVSFTDLSMKTIPLAVRIPSIYGIFTYICLFLMVRYGKCRYIYTIHGSYGVKQKNLPRLVPVQVLNIPLKNQSFGYMTDPWDERYVYLLYMNG